jgi:carotenoid cleavage dioxygenase-like enzyme
MPATSCIPSKSSALVACIALLLCTFHTSFSAPLDRLFESTWDEIDAAPAIATAPLPAWLAGSLVRAGLGAFEMGARNMTHAFDGFAKIHSWNLDGRNGTATFSTRFLNSSWFAKSKDANDISPIMTLAAVEPDWSLAQKIEGLGAKADNDNVNIVFAGADRAFALSDTKSMFEFTPSSLASVGDVVFNDSFAPDPTFITSMAHPHVYNRIEPDGKTREYVVNALGKWAMLPGTVGGYALYRMPLDSGSTGGEVVREQFGYLSLSPLCYMHSFAFTKNYVILVCAPIHFDLLGVMELEPLFKTAQWDSTQPTRIYVVCGTRGLASYFLFPLMLV